MDALGKKNRTAAASTRLNKQPAVERSSAGNPSPSIVAQDTGATAQSAAPSAKVNDLIMSFPPPLPES